MPLTIILLVLKPSLHPVDIINSVETKLCLVKVKVTKSNSIRLTHISLGLDSFYDSLHKMNNPNSF